VIRPTLPQHALWPGIHGSVSNMKLGGLRGYYRSR
jgi:hypothetical protein